MKSHSLDSPVIVYRPGFEHRAGLLSEQTGLPCQALTEAEGFQGLVLLVDEQGLALQLLGPGAPGPVRCDFSAGAARHRRLFGGGKGQDIAKAVGLGQKGFRPRLLDLTAGLGRDGFVLASLGAHVTLVERHPVVYALLRDGLDRAGQQAVEQGDVSLQEILQRIETRQGDGSEFLAGLPQDQSPDVIFLDPMFPPREKSGKVKKEMQLFHQLVGAAGPDADQMLALALERAVYRVVVKRPSHAPFLGDRKPAFSLKGKSTRFDVYTLKKLP
ncbi:MAG: SAM-dependent methyltransferase [Gammaproteobacteria bacterium]|nr:MAG: SAM-dependent methyltransferase [Gammaproteobacteria bacterium]